MVSQSYQNWQNNTWVNEFQFTYIYNENNKIVNQLFQNGQNSIWVNEELVIFTYNNNNLLNFLVQKWQNGTWVNNEQNINRYDENNNMVSQLAQIWQNNTWIDNIKWLWVYDENNNCISSESWKFAINTWKPIDYGVFFYYNNGQSFFNFTMPHKGIVSYKRVSKPDVIENFVLSTISIYPNPTTGLLNITSEEQDIRMISIFDLSGVRLFYTQGTTFDISHLPAGVYIVQIITEKGIVTKKIVKI